MDFKQLHSFISVVRCRSFTEAAEELGISQPTISTHIRILEEELNSRLIVRTAKSFEVTPRGMELFECAQNILKLRDDMVSRWNGHGSKVIRLGVSTIPSAYILPEVLPTKATMIFILLLPRATAAALLMLFIKAVMIWALWA